MSKKILITGGAGFIAHHLIDKILSTTDWEIITLDRLDFSGNLNRLKEVVSSYPEKEQKRVRVVHHDLKAELNPEIITGSSELNDNYFKKLSEIESRVFDDSNIDSIKKDYNLKILETGLLNRNALDKNGNLNAKINKKLFAI